MNSKNYGVIAEVFKSHSYLKEAAGSDERERIEAATVRILCKDFVAAFTYYDPKFDKGKFLKDCGIEL